MLATYGGYTRVFAAGVKQVAGSGGGGGRRPQESVCVRDSVERMAGWW